MFFSDHELLNETRPRPWLKTWFFSAKTLCWHYVSSTKINDYFCRACSSSAAPSNIFHATIEENLLPRYSVHFGSRTVKREKKKTVIKNFIVLRTNSLLPFHATLKTSLTVFGAPAQAAPPHQTSSTQLWKNFFFWIHTASAPIKSGTHTDGGAVIRKTGSAWLEGTPAISVMFVFCFVIVVLR